MILTRRPRTAVCRRSVLFGLAPVLVALDALADGLDVQRLVGGLDGLERRAGGREAIEAADEPLDVQPVGQRVKRDEYWGQPKEN